MSSPSLFLPDILPCPGSGICDLHARMFGSSNETDNTPKTWSCPTCHNTHPTTVNQKSEGPLSQSVASLSRLELLPTELLQNTADRLPKPYKAFLALCSRTLFHKLGTQAVKIPKGDKFPFCCVLAKSLPAYAACSECNILRPYTSELAWPLLKLHRTKTGVQESVYGLSSFLAIKAIDDEERLGKKCCIMSLLSCAGTYRKPWKEYEKAHAETAGFSRDEIDLGLPIVYEASGRIAPIFRAGKVVVTHVTYHIDLPRPWTSFALAQRFAILRDFYLCPHTYASRVQYRDPADPTFPSDSSIALWLPHDGPVPEATLTCAQCTAEFRCTFKGNDQRSIVFEVWRESERACNDGMTGTTFCQEIAPRRTTAKGLIGNQRIRALFEDAESF